MLQSQPETMTSLLDRESKTMRTLLVTLLLAGCSSSGTAATTPESDKGNDAGGPREPLGDAGMSTSNDAATEDAEAGVNGPPNAWPNSTNTGYKNAPGFPGTLTTCAGPIQSGQTYQFCDFSNGIAIGDVGHHPTNVAFVGCRFASNAVEAGNVTSYADGVTFDYCTFEPSTVSSPPTPYEKGYQFGLDLRYPSKVVVDHSDFWGWGNGISFEHSSQEKPLVVKNSYFHDAREDGGIDHTDAILSNDGGPEYAVFDHNTIVSKGNTNGLALQVVNTPYNHITITNNYFSGFGATVNTGGALLNRDMVFTGNTFGTDIKPVYRPLYAEDCWVTKGLGNTWRMNKWRIAPGGYSTNLSDDGKFWHPDGTLSDTDYSGP
jgi:hypothetical protein